MTDCGSRQQESLWNYDFFLHWARGKCGAFSLFWEEVQSSQQPRHFNRAYTYYIKEFYTFPLAFWETSFNCLLESYLLVWGMVFSSSFFLSCISFSFVSFRFNCWSLSCRNLSLSFRALSFSFSALSLSFSALSFSCRALSLSWTSLLIFFSFAFASFSSMGFSMFLSSASL